MPRTHGELFGEIGKLVFDAHHGEAIDLETASTDLASRYSELRLPAESIARAIARSAGAVGISLALVEAAVSDRVMGSADEDFRPFGPDAEAAAAADSEAPPPLPRKPAFAGLASGGRIAILS